MITCESALRVGDVIEIVPKRDGLSLLLRDSERVLPDVLVKIPLLDLLRYTKLVKDASESPPGFEDLVFASDKPR